MARHISKKALYFLKHNLRETDEFHDIPPGEPVCGRYHHSSDLVLIGHIHDLVARGRSIYIPTCDECFEEFNSACKFAGLVFEEDEEK